MIYENISGVPKFECNEFSSKSSKYCVLIPIINEGNRIKKELLRAKKHNVYQLCDIIICDGGSTDDCTNVELLKTLGVNTLLTKRDSGKQGTQLRMGFWWALQRGYDGFITIDGNNKDSIESISHFVKKLEEGYDFVQGSRYVKGGRAINTPIMRHISTRLIHAPIISLTAGKWFTDSTNAFRAHSRRYISNEKVQPFRDIFMTYELLAYLSVRANQIGLKVCEIPVVRRYPETGNTPTKISFFSGNMLLMKILVSNLFRRYNP